LSFSVFFEMLLSDTEAVFSNPTAHSYARKIPQKTELYGYSLHESTHESAVLQNKFFCLPGYVPAAVHMPSYFSDDELHFHCKEPSSYAEVSSCEFCKRASPEQNTWIESERPGCDFLSQTLQADLLHPSADHLIPRSEERRV